MKALIINGFISALILSLAIQAGAAPPTVRPDSYYTSQDTDHDGFLSFEEFRSALPQAGEAGFFHADKNKDNRISYQEWMDIQPRRGRGQRGGRGLGGGPMSGRRGETRFDAMDSNGDGYITYGEFKTSLPTAGDDVFQSGDSNGDTKLDHEEWAELARRMGFGSGRGKP
jgi:Ca2+-binding EF-hand superfamily protein